MHVCSLCCCVDFSVTTLLKSVVFNTYSACIFMVIHDHTDCWWFHVGVSGSCLDYFVDV